MAAYYIWCGRASDSRGGVGGVGAAAGGERAAAEDAGADLAAGRAARSGAGRLLRRAAGTGPPGLAQSREGGVLPGPVRGAYRYLRHPDRECPYGLEGLAPGGARRVAARGPA